MKRFELSTLSLARRCSTTELHPQSKVGLGPDHLDTMQYDGSQGQAPRRAPMRSGSPHAPPRPIKAKSAQHSQANGLLRSTILAAQSMKDKRKLQHHLKPTKVPKLREFLSEHEKSLGNHPCTRWIQGDIEKEPSNGRGNTTRPENNRVSPEVSANIESSG